MKLYKISLVLLGIVCLTSCKLSKKILYFQDDKQSEEISEIQVFEPKIQIGDMLSISVTSMNGEAAMPFNLFKIPVVGEGAAMGVPLDYLVDSQGNINFPVLGTLKVAGFTTRALTKELVEQLSTYIKDPIINIRYSNFKVTVLGDVGRPGPISVLNERINIHEALGMAGDLDIQANRKQVVLMREDNGERTFINLDLTRKDLVNSPYYYLAQNDVLYVAPNKTKINTSIIGPNISIILSSISLLLILGTLIIK